MTKKRFSFNRLLYNDKLMMIVSLLLSVAIWISVISGPANIEDRPISVTVAVDITNSYAYQSGLRVIGDNEFDVKVTVSGAWSVISKLTEEDLRVRPDLTAITGPGDVELALNVSRNSGETDYDILAVTPNTVTVMVDYWQENVAFDIETDVSLLTAADEDCMIGEPMVDQSVFPDGKAVISGPKAVVGKIDTLVARVTTAEALTEMKQYQVPLTALDANGIELDLSQCEIQNFSSQTVTMTVPIWEEHHVELGYTAVNVPKGYTADKLLTLEPASLDLLGPAEELKTLEEELKNLGTVDLTKLSLSNDTIEFPISIPQTIRAINAPSVAMVSLNTDGLSQKTVSLRVTAENTVVSGSLQGMTVSVREQTLDNILLVGDVSAINAVSTAALSVTVDVGDSPVSGTKHYPGKITVNGYDDVWVYYGNDTDEVNVYLSVS